MKNIYIILQNLFEYNKFKFILTTLIVIIIGILEISLISGAQKFSAIIFDNTIKLSLSSELIYFFTASLLIAPTRLLFIFISGKLSINFGSNLSGKLMTRKVKDWKPTDYEATSKISNALITEADLLINDILPSIWLLILSIISLIFIIFIYARTVGWETVILLTCLILCTSLICILSIYPPTKKRAIRSVSYKTKISGFVISISKSIRSLNLIDSSLKSISLILNRYEQKYRQPLLENLLLANIIKLLFEQGPYILIGIISFLSIILENNQIISKIIITPSSLIASIVVFQRIISYGYIAYTSTFIVISNSTRIPNIINFIKNQFSSHKSISKLKSYTKKDMEYDYKFVFNKIFLEFDEVHNTKSNIVNIGSFEINSGDFIGISAASGTGKSTLFDIILGLLKPTSGEYYLETKETKNKINDYKNNISFLEQKPSFFFDNIISNILMKEINQELELDKRTMKRIDKIFKLLDIEYFLENNRLYTYSGQGCETLSGGEKQLITLIRILYDNRKILILDEPTASLDDEKRDLVISCLKKQSRSGKLVIMSSHNKNDFKYCDKILIKDDISSPFSIIKNDI